MKFSDLKSNRLFQICGLNHRFLKVDPNHFLAADDYDSHFQPLNEIVHLDAELTDLGTIPMPK